MSIVSFEWPPSAEQLRAIEAANAKPVANRQTIIATAALEYRLHGTRGRLTDAEGWVNGTLIEAGMPRLTAAEAVALR